MVIHLPIYLLVEVSTSSIVTEIIIKNLGVQNMYESIDQFIRHQNFTRGGKILYFWMKENYEGKTDKEEIRKDVIDNNLMANRSFNAQWNLWEKMKSDIHFKIV